MSLLEQTDKLLTYLCRLNRLGRSGARVYPTADEARSEIQSMLADIKSKADPLVYTQDVERALWATADWLASNSRLPWAQTWKKRGFAPSGDVLTLDHDFWRSLDIMLNEPRSGAIDERLEVFAACIGVGFVGEHAMLLDRERYETIKTEMRKVWSKVKDRSDFGDKPRLTPDAYFADGSDLRPERVKPIWKYVALTVIMLVGLIAAQMILYRRAIQGLSGSLTALTAQTPAAGNSAAPATTPATTPSNGASR